MSTNEAICSLETLLRPTDRGWVLESPGMNDSEMFEVWIANECFGTAHTAAEAIEHAVTRVRKDRRF